MNLTNEMIISAMRAAAPPGRLNLDDSERAELRRLTNLLVATGGSQELHRFVAIRDRGLLIPRGRLEAWLRGRTVLVTGGTGCIGAELMAQIAEYGPGRLVSLSRGLTYTWPRLPGAEYATADITDPRGLATVFSHVRPDIVFHLAAQRDPGLAEREVHKTVSTNVFGTQNVIAISERFGAADLVCASSGKAVRPYSSEVYTASKRLMEWLLSRAADDSRCRYAAVRFTHVVDNSIILQRLTSWCQSGVIRLHDPDRMFYVQSARESAQLLLCAGLSSRAGGLRISALTDLDWPVSLLDLATGMLAKTGSSSPLYFSGHDPGYEREPFPGLYDPSTAGQVSPLLNSFEAPDVEPGPSPNIDVCPVAHAPCQTGDSLLATLAARCQASAEPAPVRAALADLAWSVFDAAMSVTGRKALTRAKRLTEPHQTGLSAEHRRMLSIISRHADSKTLAATATSSSRPA